MLLGYCRVSTLEQAKDGTTSLQEQDRVIRGMAMAQGLSAYDVQIFTDIGVSGSLPLCVRPAGKELLATAKKGDTVVASKLDRIFRNSLDALIVYGDFKRAKINLVLFDLGMQPITDDSGMSKVIFQVMSAFADHERERIKERMAEGKRAKLQSGGHIGGEAPYGYRIIGKEREARLEPVEDEQRVLEVFREHCTSLIEGGPLNVSPLTKRLNELGHRTRTGKAWSYLQVQRILERKNYAVH